jgi:ribose 5-phosphate isomerase A
MGGALLREKLVELAARELIIIVDQSKLVTVLGDRGPVPVEIVPFGWQRTKAAVEATGCQATLRIAGSAPFITDGGHFILDCHFGPIADPRALAGQLKALSGVIDHGLFLGVAGRVVTGRADGTVEVRRRGGERAT